jgi:CO/xanthine dehydrogenase Mo-binding subunit
MGEHRWVGRSVPRPDGRDKVTGTTTFVSDLAVPKMAVAKLLRLPFPHARIVDIDTRAASELPGVAAVLTAADLGDPVPRFGPLEADQPILASGRIRFQGEPVAAVAAEDERTAQQGVEAIAAECEPLRAASSLEEALAEGAPLVVDADGDGGIGSGASNVVREFRYGWGNVQDGEFARVLEGTYRFPAIQHYAVEPHGCIAAWEDGALTVWSGIQHPFILRRVLAETFELDPERVRVIVPQIGGAFGGKGYPKVEPIAAALARAAGRPVKLQLSVEESFYSTRRAAAQVKIRTGVDADGAIRAQDVEADFLVGAYRDISSRVVQKASYLACGPYRTPNARIFARAVASHTAPSSATRGFGSPQLCWALESQLDEVALALGQDPVELRLRNLPEPGEVLIPGDTPVDGDWAVAVRAAAKAIGSEELRSPGRGRGLAIGIKSAIPETESSARVFLGRGPRVTVLAGTTEMGQGSRTVLAQLAAEALGVSLDAISVPLPDTDLVPFDSLTASSRSTTLMGRAVVDACEDLLAGLGAALADALGGEWRLDAAAGEAVSEQGERLALGEALERCLGEDEELAGEGAYRGERTDNPLGGPAPFWEVSVSAVEVAVDRDTGRVEVERAAGVADVGRLIHPRQAEGQHAGATMMGLGHTLFEELHFEGGQLVNPNLIDYRVPTFAELPARNESIFIEHGDGPGPFGAKGVGESGIIPVGPSVANAVREATGVRMRDLPLTPERVWRALQEARDAEA